MRRWILQVTNPPSFFSCFFVIFLHLPGQTSHPHPDPLPTHSTHTKQANRRTTDLLSSPPHLHLLQHEPSVNLLTPLYYYSTLLYSTLSPTPLYSTILSVETSILIIFIIPFFFLVIAIKGLAKSANPLHRTSYIFSSPPSCLRIHFTPQYTLLAEISAHGFHYSSGPSTLDRRPQQ